jgi:HSP20 family molecular chaperone IbpA
MFSEACALLDEAERRHRHFFDLLSVPSATPAWEPPADVFSADSELYISVALPGARAEDIEIRIHSTGLSIEATVPPPRLSAGMQVVRLEIPYGRMRRRIELPPGRYSLREQRFENGNLHLCLVGSIL